MENQAGQNFNQEFNLDSYRDLLERLEASKRNQQRLEKQVPGGVQQQPV